jgi:hypothetical protein
MKHYNVNTGSVKTLLRKIELKKQFIEILENEARDAHPKSQEPAGLPHNNSGDAKAASDEVVQAHI